MRFLTNRLSAGATSVSFRKANLSFRRNQRITPDGRVTMTLDVNRDTPNESLNTGGNGVAIDTKHVKTEVLVENGGTVVIGGIYTQKTAANITQRVPFFGACLMLAGCSRTASGLTTRRNCLYSSHRGLLQKVSPYVD